MFALRRSKGDRGSIHELAAELLGIGGLASCHNMILYHNYRAESVSGA